MQTISPSRLMAAVAATQRALAADDDATFAAIAKETELMPIIDRLGEYGLADMALAEAARERARRLEERAAKAKALLHAILDALGQKKLERPLFTASVMNGRSSVKVSDEAAVPAQYLRPDLSALGKALREGLDVPGATLNNAPPSLRLSRI